jgi:hypothetical protein
VGGRQAASKQALSGAASAALQLQDCLLLVVVELVIVHAVVHAVEDATLHWCVFPAWKVGTGD